MPDQQLRLFPPPKPLLERLGADFFDSIPSRPGVYIMLDGRNRVAYVGQSKNLRQRLATYKNAHPERVPRKIVRLVHCVEYILWEECASASEARVRENQLLRAFRPRFNVINTYPQAYCFIGFELAGTELKFVATRENKSPLALYGAFKTRSFQAYRAMLRLLWTVFFRPTLPYDLPRLLLVERPPKEFAFQLDGKIDSGEILLWGEATVGFLEGKSSGLLEMLRTRMPAESEALPFHLEFLKAEFEILEHFFRIGPERNRILRERSGLSKTLIEQELLDDLLAHCKPGAWACGNLSH